MSCTDFLIDSDRSTGSLGFVWFETVAVKPNRVCRICIIRTDDGCYTVADADLPTLHRFAGFIRSGEGTLSVVRAIVQKQGFFVVIRIKELPVAAVFVQHKCLYAFRHFGCPFCAVEGESFCNSRQVSAVQRTAYCTCALAYKDYYIAVFQFAGAVDALERSGFRYDSLVGNHQFHRHIIRCAGNFIVPVVFAVVTVETDLTGIGAGLVCHIMERQTFTFRRVVCIAAVDPSVCVRTANPEGSAVFRHLCILKNDSAVLRQTGIGHIKRDRTFNTGFAFDTHFAEIHVVRRDSDTHCCECRDTHRARSQK